MLRSSGSAFCHYLESNNSQFVRPSERQAASHCNAGSTMGKKGKGKKGKKKAAGGDASPKKGADAAPKADQMAFKGV